MKRANRKLVEFKWQEQPHAPVPTVGWGGKRLGNISAEKDIFYRERHPSVRAAAKNW